MQIETRSQLRRRAGLTLFELGRRTGKSPGILSQWERGQVDLSSADIERIALVLEKELSKFRASSSAQLITLLAGKVEALA